MHSRTMKYIVRILCPEKQSNDKTLYTNLVKEAIEKKLSSLFQYKEKQEDFYGVKITYETKGSFVKERTLVTLGECVEKALYSILSQDPKVDYCVRQKE